MNQIPVDPLYKIKQQIEKDHQYDVNKRNFLLSLGSSLNGREIEKWFVQKNNKTRVVKKKIKYDLRNGKSTLVCCGKSIGTSGTKIYKDILKNHYDGKIYKSENIYLTDNRLPNPTHLYGPFDSKNDAEKFIIKDNTTKIQAINNMTNNIPTSTNNTTNTTNETKNTTNNTTNNTNVETKSTNYSNNNNSSNSDSNNTNNTNNNGSGSGNSNGSGNGNGSGSGSGNGNGSGNGSGSGSGSGSNIIIIKNIKYKVTDKDNSVTVENLGSSDNNSNNNNSNNNDDDDKNTISLASRVPTAIPIQTANIIRRANSFGGRKSRRRGKRKSNKLRRKLRRKSRRLKRKKSKKKK